MGNKYLVKIAAKVKEDFKTKTIRRVIKAKGMVDKANSVKKEYKKLRKEKTS